MTLFWVQTGSSMQDIGLNMKLKTKTTNLSGC